MVDVEHSDLLGAELHPPFHYVQTGDPGAVGAGLFWLDISQSPHVLSRRNGSNAAWVAIGSSFTWRGVWSLSVTYGAGDVVSRNGASYIANDENTNESPPNSHWSVFSDIGEAGPIGPTGIPGPAGPAVALSSTVSTQAFGDAAVGGASATASKGDHKHAMPANPTLAIGSRLRTSAPLAIVTATPTAIEWNTEDADNDTQHFPSAAALSGTVAKGAASATLVGTGTVFVSELAIGQVISVPGTAAEVRVVTAIADDTHLTVNSPFANTAATQTATRKNSPIVCRSARFYTFELGVYAEAISAGLVTLQFRLNGTTIIGQVDWPFVNATAAYGLVMQRPFNQWDYVEALLTQTSGGSVNVLPDERTHLSVKA